MDKKDRFKNSKINDDFDGVVYTPHSKKIKSKAKNTKARSSLNKNAPPGVYNTRKQFKIFYLLLFFISILICIFISFLIFSYVTDFNSKLNNKINTNTTESNDSRDINVTAENKKNVLGIIKNIDMSKNLLRVIDVNENKDINIYFDNSTKFFNKFNKNIISSELSVGDIIDINYLKSNTVADSISISKNFWEKRSINNVEIDSNEINVNGEFYQYSDNTQVYYNNSNYDINNINKYNVLNIKGIGNTIWFIDVLKGSGYLKIINYNRIENCTVELNSKIINFKDDFTDQDSIVFPEGKYKAIIKGNNIDTFVKSIDIENDKTTILNLDEADVKMGDLTIKTNVDNPKIIVNNKVVKNNKLSNLPYGDYNIKISADGYDPVEQNITLDQEEKTLNISLDKSVKIANWSVATNPDGADIFIDNKLVGVTPLTLNIEYGNHNVIFRKQGYYDTKIDSLFVDENIAPYQIDLIPKPESKNNYDSTHNKTNENNNINNQDKDRQYKNNQEISNQEINNQGINHQEENNQNIDNQNTEINNTSNQNSNLTNNNNISNNNSNYEENNSESNENY